MLGAVETPMALLLWVLLVVLVLLLVMYCTGMVYLMVLRVRRERSIQRWEQVTKGRR